MNRGFLQSLRPHLIPGLILVLAAFAVYGRTLGHDFLGNWDDNKYVLDNLDVHGFSWHGIQAVFTRYYVGNYAPVHLLSYMLDHSLWGLWPGGYLLDNILLHILNGLILHHLFSRLMVGWYGPFLGAAIFLLHPVQVETVAWISQRKTLLAMLFFLAAWMFYISYRDSESGRRRLLCYSASLVAASLALFSKSVAVIFPLVIILFDHCYPPVSVRRSYLDKLPYVLICLVGAVLAILSQTPDYTEWGAGGGRTAYHGGSPWATFLTMLPVFCRYLFLTFWPAGLSAYYEPTQHLTPDFMVIGAFLLLATVLLLSVRLYRYDRQTGFWPALYFIGLLPVSQIIPLVTLMNDRYLYFPMIGFSALGAISVSKICSKTAVRLRMYAFLLLLPVIILALTSFRRAAVWRNPETLWRDALATAPRSSLVWESLGEALQSRSPAEAAHAHLRALELNPGSDVSRYNLALIYTSLNEYDKAEAALRELLRRSPNNVMGWSAYGDLALKRFNYAGAEERYVKALTLQPEAVQVHRNIGNLLVVTGRIGEARNTFLRIETLPGGDDAQNAYELARVEAVAGNAGEALRWLGNALRRGYADYSGIMGDEELAPVRADGRFAELVQRYFPRQMKRQ